MKINECMNSNMTSTDVPLPTMRSLSHEHDASDCMVFAVVQATLSPDVMSLIVEANRTPVLYAALEACSCRLLHDPSSSSYTAVGCTLDSLYQLEKTLANLLAGLRRIVSTEENPDNSSNEAVSETAVPKISSASLLVSAGSDDRQKSSDNGDVVSCEKKLTACKSAPSETIEIQQTSAQNCYTKSGRRVKPKLFADYTDYGALTDTSTTKKASRQGRACKQQAAADEEVQNREVESVPHVEPENVSIDGVEPSAFAMKIKEVHLNGTAAADCQNHGAGIDMHCCVNDNLSTALYNGRTRLDSCEYEQLTPYRFFCTLCSFRSKREGHLRKHAELHARGIAVVKCQDCWFRTTRVNHLTRHRLRQHSQSAATLSCHVNGCMYTAGSQRLLRRHHTSRHGNGALQSSKLACPVLSCSYTASTEARLRRHVTGRHRSMDDTASADTQQQRTNSNCTDNDNSGIADSIGSAGLVARYECSECRYVTGHREHFRRHVDAVHRNLRPFLCDVCGRRFKCHDTLLQHAVVHSSALQDARYSHRCHVCARAFRSKSHLSEHESSVHSSARSFLCEWCGASFKTKSVQRKHVRTVHSQPAAHGCTVCGRRFSTRFALRRHANMHQLHLAAAAAGTGGNVESAELI